MSGFKLSPLEWQALTLALGIFKGQNKYLARPGNSFEQMLPAVESIIDKLDGTQFMTYGAANVRRAVDEISDGEIKLQKKLDGLK